MARFINAQSDKDTDGPERAMTMATRRKFDATLLVSKPDRLSRRVVQIAAVMEDRRSRSVRTQRESA